MLEYQEIILNVPLFRGIGAEELPALLQVLQGRVRRFGEGELLFLAGEAAHSAGLLLEGRLLLLREEYGGSRTLQAQLSPGELFGESPALLPDGAGRLPVTVQAAAPSTVLLLELGRTVGGCPGSCKCHQKLMENLLEVLAQKNLLLNRRLGHLCRRTTRDKQLSFLHEQAAAAGSNAFAIPFDRQQLADYLCVERSAMSAALSRLREEGLISYRRNRFWLTGK